MRPEVLAVIHYHDDGTAMRNAGIAAECGCRGVFLIEMNGADWRIDDVAVAIKSAMPGLMVGCNRLSTSPGEAILRNADLGLDATWCDDPGASSNGPGPIADEIDKTLAWVRGSGKTHDFFGSIAFKTQGIDPDPSAAALVAARQGWIATTSGPATGSPPDVEKLRAMKRAIGDAPLAVASGISPENAPILAPHVDWILVSTGISRSFYEFDATKLSALVDVCASIGSNPPGP